MNEEFDKQLRDRVSDVFDNYEDNTADAGWALLREKYPDKDKQRPLPLWWYSVAAGLFVFIGAALWLYNSDGGNKTNHPKTASNKPTTVQPDSASSRKSLPAQTHANPEKVATHETVNSVKQVIAKATDRSGNGNSIHNIRIKHHKFTSMVSNTGIWAGGTTPQPQQTVTHTIVNPTAIANNAVVQTYTDAGKQSAVTAPDTVAGAKKVIAQITEKAKPVKPKAKVFAWGVFISGYNNYATNSNNQFNRGGGFSADIPLSNRLNISTGLGVYQNSLNYQTTSNLYYSIPQNGTGALSSADPINTAKILALELPVKLSFQILKSGSYLSAGFSSAMFINEHYENGTSSAPLGSSSYAQQTIVTEKRFGTFIFAKTFDVSAGFAYPLGKNHIVLEPFVKMPLNSLGQPEFNYGSAGFNLKFTLGSGR